MLLVNALKCVKCVKCCTEDGEQGARDRNSNRQNSREHISSEAEHSSNKSSCSEYIQKLWGSDLSPYNDNSNNKMSGKETAYFFINYSVVLVLFICSSVTSLYYVSTVHSYCWMTGVYLLMIVLQLVSHFSAIQSCFIFSKIVYKITKQLKNIAEEICKEDKTMTKLQPDHHGHNLTLPQSDTRPNSSQTSDALSCAAYCLVYKEKVDRENFHQLQKIDKEFIDQVKSTLHLFGVWFIFHWTLYALTTVLLSAFIIEIVIKIIQNDLNSANSYLPDGEDYTRAPYVLYVLSFTLVHGYLFLYPCFRAAAIATARAKMINKISEKQWANIPLSIQTSFVQYLTSKNFAFQVPLFCASIPIGFNWVFVSFFVPVLGVYLAL